jgi:aconitase A
MGATYDKEIEIDLSAVEPLIALPEVQAMSLQLEKSVGLL